MKSMDEVKDDLSFSLFGRNRSLSIAGQGCVCCGKSARSFRDDVSTREFQISGMCQICQDVVFCATDEPMDDEV